METKSIIKNYLLIIVSCALLTSIKAQTPWLASGNPGAGVNSIDNTNNFLGTNGNFAINVRTNANSRMILENGGVGLNGGQMALGNSLPLSFNAVDRLHMNQTSFSNVRLRFTFDGLNQDGTATIGSTATDGSTIGINTFGEFMFTQFENKSMIFQTNGATERFRITENDRIIAFRKNSGYSDLECQI